MSKQKPKPPRKLTLKQECFCIEFIKDFNGKQAALRAGYSPKGAEQEAVRLLKDERVQAKVGVVSAQALGITQQEANEVVQLIKDMAFVDPSDIFDDDGQMKPLSTIPKAARMYITGISISDKGGRKVTLEPRSKMLDMLGKYLKLWTDGLNLNIDTGAGTTNFTVEFTGGAR